MEVVMLVDFLSHMVHPQVLIPSTQSLNLHWMDIPHAFNFTGCGLGFLQSIQVMILPFSRSISRSDRIHR